MKHLPMSCPVSQEPPKALEQLEQLLELNEGDSREERVFRRAWLSAALRRRLLTAAAGGVLYTRWGQMIQTNKL